MYNLFVAWDVDSWNGEPWVVDAGRAVSEHEYTNEAIVAKYGALDIDAIEVLKRLPSIFAYESCRNLSPKFGVIRDVKKRQGKVRVEYELIPVSPFLSANDLEGLLFDLDIGRWELNRTHWAVKDVELAKELHRKGIALPAWVRGVGKVVDIGTHIFDVGLSFPGEVRLLVEDVARHLERLIGPNAYFYDNNYYSQLARPSLDLLLQDIYRNRSRLVVVFLSSDYQRKDWCGIEFRAIRDIIAARQHNRVMFIRTDDGEVEGVFATDGYVDSRRYSPERIAEFIQQRLMLL